MLKCFLFFFCNKTSITLLIRNSFLLRRIIHAFGFYHHKQCFIMAFIPLLWELDPVYRATHVYNLYVHTDSDICCYLVAVCGGEGKSITKALLRFQHVCQQKRTPSKLQCSLCCGFDRDDNDDQNYSTDKCDDVQDFGCPRCFCSSSCFPKSIRILYLAGADDSCNPQRQTAT